MMNFNDTLSSTSGGASSSGFQISEKELVGREDLIQPMLVRDGDTLSLDLIYELLANEIAYQGIPTAIGYGTLKTGGMFSRETENIIVLTNEEHPHDYLRHLIRFRMRGNRVAEIRVYAHGISRMFIKREQMEASPSVLNRLSGAQRQVEMKAEEEETYYMSLTMCIQAVYDQIIIPD